MLSLLSNNNNNNGLCPVLGDLSSILTAPAAPLQRLRRGGRGVRRRGAGLRRAWQSCQ